MARTSQHPNLIESLSTALAGARPSGRAGVSSSERLIGGVPARIMRPRLVFIACLVALVGFGLLMVYSASAIEALADPQIEDATYYFTRQAIFIAVGAIACVVAAFVPLDTWLTNKTWICWTVVLLFLVVTPLVGTEANGARRWITIPLLGQLQPSEFAKATVVLTAAKIFSDYYEGTRIDTPTFIKLLAVCVGVPVVCIMLEPDMGSSVIIVTSIVFMCYLAGFSYALLIGGLVILGALFVIFVAIEPYRLQRFMADPWLDEYDTGYQATRAIMAFASGGLFGRGIGNSTIKYSYLPEAHNDYILAIVGEEVGFVGLIVLFAVFTAFAFAGLKIARQSPTLQGRLIAAGCTVIFMVQFLINALGVIGVIPMTGKPLPFISAGGSSMISCLILSGLILRVSIESNVRTLHDARRERFELVDESTAGPARRRSERAGSFTVYEGGKGAGTADAPRPRGAGRSGGGEGRAPWRGDAGASPRTGAGPGRAGARDGRGAARAGGYERVNLGPDPSERLRTRGPHVRLGGGYRPADAGERTRSRRDGQTR